MAKDKQQEQKAPRSAETPAAEQQGQGQAAAQPGIQIVAQYIKDLSFENPNAPESLIAGWPHPEANVQVFLRHAVLRDDAYECVLNLNVQAKKPGEERVAFIVELSYGAVVVLKNVPKENHAAVVMVEVPKLTFPFAREIIANATAAGGFAPMYLTPISFEQLYINEVKRQQEQRAAGA